MLWYTIESILGGGVSLPPRWRQFKVAFRDRWLLDEGLTGKLQELTERLTNAGYKVRLGSVGEETIVTVTR